MKTYSRLDRNRLGASEPPAKRRRISSTDNRNTKPLEVTDTISDEHNVESFRAPSMPVSSSPPQEGALAALIPSDEIEPTSTPPSSPQRAVSPILPHKQNAFSIMRRPPPSVGVNKKKSKPRPALSDASGNARPLTKPPTKDKPKQRLTQLHLDLGQPISRRCDVCSMSYIVTNPDDVALHKKFHAQNIGGIDLGKTFIESEAFRGNTVWEGGGGNLVVECSRKDGKALKRNVRCVLDVVNQELGAVNIEDEVLWAQVQHTKREDEDIAKGGLDRFKAFLYVRGSKCVALCLVERIERAGRVLEQKDKPANSSISVSDVKDPVVMGISRIWTSNEHRKKGLATLLLNCASENFLYGMEVRDEEMAFSQPTESGVLLARKWFGGRAGWHVYDDT